ncbi:MAG TPA: hypothetical protein DFL85_12070, partial [Lentisphaeria bacterium]|nr:hypothetical protein [Lentisphaeria bacterium]
GRCQQVNSRLIVDGGHNPDGLAALAESLEEAFPGETFSVVFAGFKDKNVAGSLHMLDKLAARFIFAPLSESDRPSYTGAELCGLARREGLSAETAAAGSAREALELASQDQAHKTLVAGSLYLAGEVLSLTMDKPAILNLD